MSAKTKKITMSVDNQESSNFLVKAGLYIIGILLGLASKLAMLHKEKTLTVKEFVLHGAIAFSCAWAVWAILAHFGRLDLANIASVIVGRYADWILSAIWKSIRNAINNNSNNPKF